MAAEGIDKLLTLSEEELAATLALPHDTFAALDKTLVDNPRSTIEPLPPTSSDAPGARALDSLDELGDDRTQGILASLAVGRTLGEGGMGIVRLATQRSLGRSVAVKTLRNDAPDRATKLRLLREAWVTGALEHPNIVPVYDLGLDEVGRPVIVLKHIEGASWEEVLEDPSVLEGTVRGRDPLEQNLRIFLQICHAVSLAHSRGVLHRDIKPENVMLGRFGEVYLVDWGIAVSLRDDPSGRLPLAKDSQGIAGTPCYMAPEMLGIGLPLSERTDVYLLGATLHEILTGAPPHNHAGIRAIMVSALTSTFTFGADVPEELARIAQKAMSRAAGDRYTSAHEMREDIERYLEDRGALALAAAALARLGELDALLAGELGGDTRERAYRLYAECRFGLRQALAASERCADAKEALTRAARTMIEFELSHGTAEAAASVLAELDDAPEPLRRRVNEGLERHRERVRKLEALETAHDPAVGRRTRVAAASILGALWSVVPFVMKWGLSRTRGAEYVAYYASTVGILLFAIAVGVWGRDSLSKSEVNRRTMKLVLVMFAGILFQTVIAQILGLPLEVAIALHFTTWLVVALAVVATVDVRAWPASIGYLVAGVVAAKRPEWLFECMAAANFMLLLTLVRAWASLSLDKPRALGGPGTGASARGER